MSMHSIDPSLERVKPPPSFQTRSQPLTQERLGNQQQQQNSQHHDSHSHQGATARREFETIMRPVRWSRRWWCSNSIVRVSTPIIKRWHTWFYWKWWGGYSWSGAGRVSVSLLYGKATKESSLSAPACVDCNWTLERCIRSWSLQYLGTVRIKRIVMKQITKIFNYPQEDEQVSTKVKHETGIYVKFEYTSSILYSQCQYTSSCSTQFEQ